MFVGSHDAQPDRAIQHALNAQSKKLEPDLSLDLWKIIAQKVSEPTKQKIKDMVKEANTFKSKSPIEKLQLQVGERFRISCVLFKPNQFNIHIYALKPKIQLIGKVYDNVMIVYKSRTRGIITYRHSVFNTPDDSARFAFLFMYTYDKVKFRDTFPGYCSVFEGA